jgi:hypothetical protein
MRVHSHRSTFLQFQYVSTVVDEACCSRRVCVNFDIYRQMLVSCPTAADYVASNFFQRESISEASCYEA